MRLVVPRRFGRASLPVIAGLAVAVAGMVGYTQLASSQTQDKSADPHAWVVDGSGLVDRSRIADRLRIGVGDLAKSGVGWIASNDFLADPSDARRRDGPYPIYAQPTDGEVVAWFYRSAWAVPVGTTQTQVNAAAAARARTTPTTLPPEGEAAPDRTPATTGR